MILRPANREELRCLLAEAYARGERISGFELSALGRLLDHKVEDMTAKAEAGMTLAAFQAQLAGRGQWLPLDPPAPEELSIGALLATNASGPRRFGYGTARDYLLGLTVALADGRLIRSGGNVVKNVAGYDLMKLFIGSRGSFGLIVEATFKLRPLPEIEKFVEAGCRALSDAQALFEKVLASQLTPVVFDLHNQPALTPACAALVLGFAGTVDEVDWQLSGAAELGFTKPSSLDYARRFAGQDRTLGRISVLPSKAIEAVRGLQGAPFVARLGNGVIYHKGRAASEPEPRPEARLLQRLKEEFDPKHILSELPS